jgi:hypothetical protein
MLTKELRKKEQIQQKDNSGHQAKLSIPAASFPANSEPVSSTSAM